MTRLMLAAASAVALAACGGDDLKAQTGQPSEPKRSGAPAETRPPNGKDQAPAFAGQTRAPDAPTNVAYQASDYVTGLERPWGMVFLPDGSLLISERPGRLRLFADGELSAPIAGVPRVDTRGQGGLLGLALDPDFARNSLVYMSYAEGHADGKTNTAVARARLVRAAGQAPRLEGLTTIWRQRPAWESTLHYGSRLVFARDGNLFVTTGERSVVSGRMQAQNLDAALGKVVRIKPNGAVPPDNPFVDRPSALPEIWSIGHRNIQAAALNPATGELWEVEHGTRGGDELNIVKKGHDYGWPTAAYGIEYSGGQITGGVQRQAGTDQPIYYWDPVIAPSGMAFYTGDLFPAWKGSLFVGGLGSKRVSRLVLDGDRVVGEEWLFNELGERIRDVIQGPDGALYLATDNETGRVIRIGAK